MDADWEDVCAVCDGGNSSSSNGFAFPPKAATPSSGIPTTLVLVGRTGNGKSATGNSILGAKRFLSQLGVGSVTTTCELQSVDRPDGRCLRVIDTPGLFDPAVEPGYIGREIVKCIELAQGGIHGILLVLSIRNRFTPEEISAVESLQSIFGEKVLNYMILVFTGGDELDEGDTLEAYLRRGAPQFLKEFMVKCGNRKVLFDNRTKDKRQKEKQVTQLLKILDDMVAANSRMPYTNEYFQEAQKLHAEQQGNNKSADVEARVSLLEQGLKQVPAKVEESVLRRLEERLVEERERAEKSEAAMRKLQEQLEEVQRKNQEELNEAARQREEARQTAEKDRKRREEMEREFQQKYSRSRCPIL